ncbi:ribosomal protein L12E/L44/L45/RPP1/RPP2 [Prauserella sediminis]|uniref:Ribosomal protein L12E/L44/L45/RPP1/RPP2 n=1 Tax=Prauserella sediminis TaxID=577680 RepID=A0A839XW58_9PSEU|nr:hypothetical protein [Prauserella sediminis]MBB3664743.1 ribosomal protein L12E/L44/L45/RPP1/RPP2 [Prauserella sediminis]
MSEDETREIQPAAVAAGPVLRAAERGAPMLSGRELKRMATDGGFTVDETTGNRMISALEDILEALNNRWATLSKLETSPPLSATSTAKWVAQHTVNTAADERGLLTQLRQAKEELPQYIQAIREAKRRYADTESGARGELESFHDRF